MPEPSRQDIIGLADVMLLSILRSENDIVKIAEAIVTWRRAREAREDRTASTPALCGTGNPEAGDYAGLIEAIERKGS